MSEAYDQMLPFIVLNLGAEMVYILDQRLRSQDVSRDRAIKVLDDIVKSMLASAFVEELFRPQEMYTMNATKQIFKKLAHSSIMKLNDTSMQKLFDLMVMGLKYQVQLTVQPEELYFITAKHLDTMKALVEGTQAEQQVISTRSRFDSIC